MLTTLIFNKFKKDLLKRDLKTIFLVRNRFSIGILLILHFFSNSFEVFPKVYALPDSYAYSDKDSYECSTEQKNKENVSLNNYQTQDNLIKQKIVEGNENEQ